MPVTIEATEDALNSAIQSYYIILETGTESDVKEALALISNLQSLKDSFLSGAPNVLMLQLATSFFETAAANPTSENIENAFSYFSTYSAYVKNNSIGYDTTTNSPIFPTGDKLVVYDNNGIDHIISSTGD